jgi:hypothetical protein
LITHEPGEDLPNACGAVHDGDQVEGEAGGDPNRESAQVDVSEDFRDFTLVEHG